MTMKNNKIKFIILIASLIGISFLGIILGGVNINLKDVLEILKIKIFNLNNEQLAPKYMAIIWQLRIPRVLTGIVSGATLGISGLMFQTILKNPIASPYTLGISTGASIGIALGLILGLGSFLSTLLSFTISILVVGFILMIATIYDKSLSNVSIILIGMVTSLTLNGVLTLLILTAGELSSQIIYWQMGSLSLKTYKNFTDLLVVLTISIVYLGFKHSELDILSFGEMEAQKIGLDVKKLKIGIIGIATLLTAIVVSMNGIIGFVGLVSPHITRKIFGSKHRLLIPGTMIIGSIILVLSDTVARTIMQPIELPVGAVTALIGGPFFGYIYLRKGAKNVKS